MEETTTLFLVATAALAAYAVAAVAFYRVLHQRDPGLAAVRRRLDQQGAGADRRRRVERAWQYGAVPLLACVAAVVLAVLNTAIIDDREVEDVYAISAAVVAAVRILAYAWREPANELAKMVPIAVLSLALFNASSIDLVAWRSGLVEAGAENAPVYVAALIALEWILQGTVDLRAARASG